MVRRIRPTRSKEWNLVSLLKKYFSSTLLSNKVDGYRCEKCNEHIEINFVSLTHRIYLPPKYLVISLKRFKQNNYGYLSKINDKVHFEEKLDITDFVACKIYFFNSLGEGGQENRAALYRLYGVVRHMGSMHGGHYVAYTKHEGRWFYLSDSFYREVDFNEVQKAQAYMLFYEKLN